MFACFWAQKPRKRLRRRPRSFAGFIKTQLWQSSQNKLKNIELKILRYEPLTAIEEKYLHLSLNALEYGPAKWRRRVTVMHCPGEETGVKRTRQQCKEGAGEEKIGGEEREERR